MYEITRSLLRDFIVEVDRATAMRQGKLFYNGKRCNKHPGHQGKRYTSNGRCELCACRKAAEHAHGRANARALGARFYRGKVCSKHPELEGERYTSNGLCKWCAQDTARKHYASKGSAGPQTDSAAEGGQP